MSCFIEEMAPYIKLFAAVQHFLAFQSNRELLVLAQLFLVQLRDEIKGLCANPKNLREAGTKAYLASGLILILISKIQHILAKPG